MQFALLLDLIPDHRPELLALNIANHRSIPDGEYVVEDGYCLDPACDCCRAMIQVRDVTDGTCYATISLGWRPLRFYEDWIGEPADLELAKNLRGPALWIGAEQHDCAEDFLGILMKSLLNYGYKMKLKRRYATFKAYVSRERN